MFKGHIKSSENVCIIITFMYIFCSIRSFIIIRMNDFFSLITLCAKNVLSQQLNTIFNAKC